MNLRRIKFSAIAVILFALLLAAGVAQPTGSSAAVPTTMASVPITFTFEGCWEPNLFSTCRDVYRDDQGNYWICKNCGTTGTPTTGKCTLTSLAALDRGFWCS